MTAAITGAAIALAAIAGVVALAVLGHVNGEAAFGALMTLAGGGTAHAIKSS